VKVNKKQTHADATEAEPSRAPGEAKGAVGAEPGACRGNRRSAQMTKNLPGPDLRKNFARCKILAAT